MKVKGDKEKMDKILTFFSVERGHVQIVSRLLEHPLVDPSYHCQAPLVTASFCGQVEIMKMLMKDPRVYPHRDAVNKACLKGQVGVMVPPLHPSLTLHPSIFTCLNLPFSRKSCSQMTGLIFPMHYSGLVNMGTRIL